FIAALVADYFLPSDRGRIYGFIPSGDLIGAGIGFAVTGDIAALSWRAAFVALAIPAFVLAWLIWRLPEPARGGQEPLIAEGAEPEAEAADELRHRTAAQQLARDKGIQPHQALVLPEGPA